MRLTRLTWRGVICRHCSYCKSSVFEWVLSHKPQTTHLPPLPTGTLDLREGIQKGHVVTVVTTRFNKRLWRLDCVNALVHTCRYMLTSARGPKKIKRAGEIGCDRERRVGEREREGEGGRDESKEVSAATDNASFYSTSKVAEMEKWSLCCCPNKNTNKLPTPENVCWHVPLSRFT